MKNILVTGAAGFIASSLIDELLKAEQYFVVGIDNFLSGEMNNIAQHPRYKFIRADANNFKDVSTIMTRFDFDYVFHYAAVVGVKRTLDHPSWVLDDIQGIKNILDLSKNTGVKRIFYSSSSEVYGEPVEIPQHEETTPLNSRLPYAIVKNVGESYLKVYHQEFGLPYTILRFFNTYGPKQSKDFVITKFLDAAERNADITIYGDGQQTRTFCYITDNIDFTLKILENALFVNDVVNVGHDRQYTMNELAKLILDISGSKSKITYLDALKEGDMTRRQPDITKMCKELKRDFVTLEDGLRRILEERKRKA
jgi:nucleoside-diphosphate-sugar epimerase